MPTKNLPALRAPIFIEAFEALVASRQREIDEANLMQGIYQACHRVFSSAGLENEIRFELKPGAVNITLTLLPRDQKSTFLNLLETLANEFAKIKARSAEEPVNLCSEGLVFTARFRLPLLQKAGTDSLGRRFRIPEVTISLDVPPAGTDFIEVRTTVRTYAGQYHDDCAIWHEEPRGSRPAGASPAEVPSRPDLLARDEIPF